MTSNISVNTFKRKRKKEGCANPLFEKWLMEWRDEAANKEWKTKYVYDKALKSLRKYPLPLKSGKEAKILEFFGDKICSMLDKKLAQKYTEIDTSSSSDRDPARTKDSGKSSQNVLDLLSDSSSSSPTKKQSQSDGKPKREYIPVRRSGPYAILIALYKDNFNDGSVGCLKKAELIAVAQPLSDKSFITPDAGSFYTAWSSMGTLIKKGLVIKEGSPARYRLSESGSKLAEKILQGEERGVDKSVATFSSTCRSSQSQETVLDDDCCSQSSFTPTSNLLVDDQFRLEPGQFDILLCVDNCETVSSANDRKFAIQSELRKNGVNFDVRKLQIGDYLWIARERVSPVPGLIHLPKARELVLDYIIERKRKDDLAHSIKDGRFKEQKYRLKNCGLRCPIYLIEDYGVKNQLGLPESTLIQAISNTQVCGLLNLSNIVDGFLVKHMKDQAESVAYLTIMTRYLQSRCNSKALVSRPLRNLEADINDFDRAKEIRLATFTEFSRSSVKNKPLTVTELFVKQLLKVSGLSIDKAQALVEVYPTPMSLYNAYVVCSSEKERENLLSTIRSGKSGRNFGPALSKVLNHLYTKDILT